MGWCVPLDLQIPKLARVVKVKGRLSHCECWRTGEGARGVRSRRVAELERHSSSDQILACQGIYLKRFHGKFLWRAKEPRTDNWSSGNQILRVKKQPVPCRRSGKYGRKPVRSGQWLPDWAQMQKWSIQKVEEGMVEIKGYCPSVQCGVRKARTQMQMKLTRKKKELSPGFLWVHCQRKNV